MARIEHPSSRSSHLTLLLGLLLAVVLAADTVWWRHARDKKVVDKVRPDDGAPAYLPFLVGKLLVGTSGWLPAAFCPETGPRRSGTMWLIFALAASVAPIGLITLRRYIRVPEAGRRDFD